MFCAFAVVPIMKNESRSSLLMSLLVCEFMSLVFELMGLLVDEFLSLVFEFMSLLVDEFLS